MNKFLTYTFIVKSDKLGMSGKLTALHGTLKNTIPCSVLIQNTFEYQILIPRHTRKENKPNASLSEEKNECFT